ncbi:MerR family transcriptional regulator [Paenibacillus segetis]|uniref:Heavy metal-responsive transcriptional regulator n=1 Tax=Paenibacillus segetis TaxID=1325360 RepID=A0ABQ1YCR5_9BACL|nr:MerR family transcriptional regulator [Paenibacillus segetis]GGH19594.1 heavy metal-responsive transcriptional regulator [Paenibacillus segetis]
MRKYLRGEIASLANVNMATLRYYENHGLIPAPPRSESGYRLYSEDVLTRMEFIKNAKLCGFTLKEIKKALINSADGSISITDFIDFINRKMDRIDEEIAAKEQTKHMLLELKNNLESTMKAPEVQEVLDILHMDS